MYHTISGPLCMYACMHACMCVCMCVCMYVCMYVYVPYHTIPYHTIPYIHTGTWVLGLELSHASSAAAGTCARRSSWSSTYLYTYIPRGPSVLILRTSSYFSSVNFKSGFYYFWALAIILEISRDLWVKSIYLSTYRSIMHSSACGSTGCVNTTLIYHVDLLDVWTYWIDR